MALVDYGGRSGGEEERGFCWHEGFLKVGKFRLHAGLGQILGANLSEKTAA